MPKRREDVLKRAEELMGKYKPRQLLAWKAKNAEGRLKIHLRLNKIERQLMEEFGIARPTAVSQVAHIIRQMNADQKKKGWPGLKRWS